MNLKAVKEALDNNWEDRIFLHYKELVDPKAIRPQNTKSKEWLNMVSALKVKVDASNKTEQVKPKLKSNDNSTSTGN